jgi:cyclin T
MPADFAGLGEVWYFTGSQIGESSTSRIDGLGEGWYFTRSQIDESSPSRIDGIDPAEEDRLRKSYCRFIKHVAMGLGLPQVTIATAIILCHRFYLRQSHSKNDRYTIVTSCLLLANKITEVRRKLFEDLTRLSYEVLHEKADPATAELIKDPQFFQKRKQLLLKGEHLVLSTLNFDLDIETPYKPLVSALKKFNAERWHSQFAQVSWNFVNDGLMTTVCLQFEPLQVAGAAFFLASKFLHIQLPLDTENPWFLEFDLSILQLENICSQLIEFYGTRTLRTPTPSPIAPQGGNSSSAGNTNADYTPTSTITGASVDSRQEESHPAINAAEYHWA